MPDREHNPGWRVDKIALSLYLVAIAAGLQVLLGGPTTGSTSAQLPPAMIYFQSTAFAIGGALAIFGRTRRKADVGLLLEAAGDLLLCAASAAYVVTAITALGVIVPAPVQIMGGLAVGTGWRLFDIRDSLKWLDAHPRILPTWTREDDRP